MTAVASSSCMARTTPPVQPTVVEPAPDGASTSVPAPSPNSRTTTATTSSQIPMVGGYLIEVAPGRITRLWEQSGYPSGTSVSFSADGSLLTYLRPGAGVPTH